VNRIRSCVIRPTEGPEMKGKPPAFYLE